MLHPYILCVQLVKHTIAKVLYEGESVECFFVSVMELGTNKISRTREMKFRTKGSLAVCFCKNL